MSKFDLAFQLLLKHEGGFVNNPLDMGGPTNMGVTQGDLAHFYNRPVSLEEVQNLTIDQAKFFYLARFWDLMKLEGLVNKRLAAILFDQGVLRGANRIIQDVQHLLGLDPDGIMGAHTILALNNQPEIEFGMKVIKASQLAFVYIAQQKPTQVEFLSGWISRTHSLIDFLLFSI